VQLLLSNYTLNNIPNNAKPKLSATTKRNVYIMRFVQFNKNGKWNNYVRRLRTILWCLICQKSVGDCEDNGVKGNHEIRHLFTAKCKTNRLSELQSSLKGNINYYVRKRTTQYEQYEI
jgi:hypothetical protein